jgi:hypothetical protein
MTQEIYEMGVRIERWQLRAEVERLTEAARRSDLYARSNQAELGAQVERLTAALKDLRERSVEEGIQHFVKRIDVALS